MDSRGIAHIFIDNVYAVNMCMSELQTGQQEIFDYVKTNLGDGMVEVELDPKTLRNSTAKSDLTDIVKDHPMQWRNPMLS
jgi:3-isopropylmalate dehydratase small subunit